MLCLACARSGFPLCEGCRAGLRAGTPFTTHGLMVYPAFAHRATAVRLVHNLKYRRSTTVARLLAKEMARRIPVEAQALVPVPRVLIRRVIHGIDQTAVLARHIGTEIGLPVVDALRVPVWQQRLAGTSRQNRRSPSIRAIAYPTSVVLIDDVVTTGATLRSASYALGTSNVVGAVTATSAARTMRRSPVSPTGSRVITSCDGPWS